MKHQDLNDRLPEITARLVESTLSLDRIQHLNRVFLPNRDVIVAAIQKLRDICFPGYFGKQGLTRANLGSRTAELLQELSDMLYEQVRCCLRYRQQIPGNDADGEHCERCDRQAAEIVHGFLQRLPDVRILLAGDVQAAFDSDPAAQYTDETILCYPGLFAIMLQRLAHEFFRLEVPLLPRIMTEHAHTITGIDINPGAKLAKSLFIDHGTGVVIGETTEIGDNVKIYQGVTLGALAPAFGQLLRGQKRHPTIEDDVTIYAGATILGGETVIGRGATIGRSEEHTSELQSQSNLVCRL